MRPQRFPLDFGELEKKVRWEPVDVALNLLVQTLGRDAVQHCQVAIQHDSLPANLVDQWLDLIDQNQFGFGGHGTLSSGRFNV